MQIPKLGEVRKPSKTLAGVTPIAVMTYPRGCDHGDCLYCPSLNVPQSYTPKSPPVIRAEMLKYDARKQVESRLKAFTVMNHPTAKIELIIMGGTFLEYPKDYREKFIKECYDALNGVESESLSEAKTINEGAVHRMVALCIETRPDSITEENIKLMLNYGATRVELGVQCLNDKIYKFINRGHTVADVVNATARLKNAGFKVGYHMMLGLPLSTPEKDFEAFETLFNDERFKPDQLKIYPCQVIQGAGLVKMYEKGKYEPYSQEVIEKLVIKIMKIIPNYCRVMRIMREIPPEYLVSGTKRIDLRVDIETALKENGGKINEIRFREIGFAIRDLVKGGSINEELEMKIFEYGSCNGREYFLEIVNKDNILFGLCRLRVIGDIAYIRELHVYGKALSLGDVGAEFGQHLGLGKRLMARAEDIVSGLDVKELRVISGIGVREYYKKIGYEKDEFGYMTKKFIL